MFQRVNVVTDSLTVQEIIWMEPDIKYKYETVVEKTSTRNFTLWSENVNFTA